MSLIDSRGISRGDGQVTDGQIFLGKRIKEVRSVVISLVVTDGGDGSLPLLSLIVLPSRLVIDVVLVRRILPDIRGVGSVESTVGFVQIERLASAGSMIDPVPFTLVRIQNIGKGDGVHVDNGAHCLEADEHLPRKCCGGISIVDQVVFEDIRVVMEQISVKLKGSGHSSSSKKLSDFGGKELYEGTCIQAQISV